MMTARHMTRRPRGRWTTVCLLGLAALWISIAHSLLGQPSDPSDPSDPARDPVQTGPRDAGDVLSGDAEEGPADSEARIGTPSMERLLFNAAERTRAGRQALDGDDADRAVDRFDTALRLEPEDPVTRYNAGTARLADQRPGARELLEAAAQDAPASLKAPVSYNLGNARLDAGDFQGAIAAYEDALRADPGFADAKHNLEVALRRLQEQQQNPQQDPDPQQNQQDQQEQDEQQDSSQQDQSQQDPSQQDQEGQGQEEQDQEEQNQEGQEPDRDDSESDDSQGDQDPQEQNPEGESGESDETDEGGGAGQGGQESPLPQFQDLPDMTAEEAAAILEAIENMERQDRREQALEAAQRAAARGKKDW